MSLFRPEIRTAADFVASATYNPFENPAVPLASVGFDTVFGGQNNDAGMQVTQDSGATVATFYRCLFLLSSVVASCPIEVYRPKTHALVTSADSVGARLFDPENADLSYTPFEREQLVMIYRLAWGDSYVFKKRDNYGSIIDLKPLHPSFVMPKLDDQGNKIFLVKRVRPDGTVDETSKPLIYTDWEILHIPGMGYDGLQGLPITKLMAQTLGTAMAADKLAARFYSAGTQLGGIIKVKAPLTSQTQAEGIKNRWMQKNAGVAHAGDVAILDAETDWQSITIPPEQLQFLESRRWQTTEIARWFGVPPHLVGDVEKSTSWGTGIEQQNLGLHTYTLSGHTTPIEQRYSRELLVRGQVAKFNLDALMRGSMNERYQALQLGAGGPWITRNEARISENKKPLDDPEYDKLLPPQGIGPEQPDENSQPAPPPQPKPRKPAGKSTSNGQRAETRDAASEAFALESEDYPPEATAWMHEATWTGPVDVPEHHIDPDMHRMDEADQDHVQHFVDKLEKGKRLKPVILVKVPGNPLLQLVDGHHRYLASIEKNRSVLAFIGTVSEKTGPWDTMHEHQARRKHH